MDYKKLYASKLCTAREAVKVVTSGDWVDYGWCTGHPVALDQALAARMSELEDVKVRGGIALWRPAIFDIENPAAHFSWNSWHMSGIERKAVNEGFAYYSPIRYSELPRYYAENVQPIHVAMFQVHRWMNMGSLILDRVPLIWPACANVHRLLLWKLITICRDVLEVSMRVFIFHRLHI